MEFAQTGVSFLNFEPFIKTAAWFHPQLSSLFMHSVKFSKPEADLFWNVVKNIVSSPFVKTLFASLWNVTKNWVFFEFVVVNEKFCELE